METCPRCGDALPERSRFCPACGAAISAAVVERERRKVVTVVFADVVGSTALGELVDPETLRWAMERWFDRMRGVVERHGGTIENYIGDAVMAVFGVPVAHEDDALRAVRAAAEMRAEVAALRDELRRERGIELAVRIGVNTGEAVTGASVAAASFTAGDTVNVAARLEQSARPGDVLLGRDTFRLVRHAVEAEPIAPLTLKGKEKTVEAFRLVAVQADEAGRPRRPPGPMVGRQRERRRVLDAFHQAVADRSCQLFTIIGAAGVGKSRLVTEVLETIDDAATVAFGRCLPYGDGLTWWPLVEALGDGLLEQAAAYDEPAAARVAELVKPEGEPVAPDEAFWTVRRVLEALARRRPLVLVVDDLQWAEPVFVELVERVAEWTRDAPILLLIMARNELLDARPDWAGGKLNATTVLLEPLPDNDARDLVRNLVGPERLDDSGVARILALAEGNPLFVEEVVAMLIDDGVLVPSEVAGPSMAELSEIAVPPTIQALIAARLDRLGAGERAVIEGATIEGKEFGRKRLEALVTDSTHKAVGDHLRALVRKDLIRPFGPSEDGFRFRHQLIRDAAYAGMSKDLRADLHERFADGLQPADPSVAPVVDELLGYHLECAVTLRRELGDNGSATAALAARAATSLRAAGRRAAQREDPASVRLLERALALTPQPDRAPVLGELADALVGAGDLMAAGATANASLELAESVGDRRTAARARVMNLRVAMDRMEGDSDLAAFDAAARNVLGETESLGDDESMAAVLLLLGNINMDRFEQAWDYNERALAAAERAGDRKAAAHATGSLGLITAFGPVPAEEGIERCRALRARVPHLAGTHGSLLRNEAVLHAMRGHFDEARALCAEADRIVYGLGVPRPMAGRAFGQCTIELLAGAPDRAETAARESLAIFEQMGATNQGSTVAAFLAVALAQQGRDDEALRYADLAAAWAVPDDTASQVGQLVARASVLAARGELERAEEAAREGVRLSERSDEISQRGDALVSLAAVLDRRGHADEAAAALNNAIALYERKGNVVGAGRAQSMLRQLQPLGAGE